jgi:hypothetical protein
MKIGLSSYLCRRGFTLVLGLLFGLAGFGSLNAREQIVNGPTFEGAIFSPQMIAETAMKGEQHWDIPGVDYYAHNTYWTPSPTLVRSAEAALAKQYLAAQKGMPPGGPHAKAYYSPKYFSPDRERKVPDDVYDNFLYNAEPDLITPHFKRQYIGVTSNGRRLLVMNIVFDDQSKSLYLSGPIDGWKTNWLVIDDAGESIIYDIDSGKLIEADF